MAAFRATRALFQHRQPMIKFMGKRTVPATIDHTPRPHPENPSQTLPESFASYRQKAIQHGPLGGQQRHAVAPASSSSASAGHGGMGSLSARSLGSVEPSKGEFWDRSELPKRFGRTPWSQAEIDAVESGGASMFA